MKFTFTTSKTMILKSFQILSLLLLIPYEILNAQNHNFEWAYGLGGNVNAQDRAGKIHTDLNNNVYITGSLLGPADFDPGTGTTNLPTSFFDAFISKMDASGNLVWAKTFGGTNSDVGNGISTDNNGNVYVTGQFYNSGDFDPGAGTVNLSSNGQYDMFISKFDINGDLVWAKSLGGTLFDRGTDVVADNAGNVYITGSFGGTVDFDPGAGTTNITSTANQDIFLMKLDVNGDFMWANNFGNLGSNEGTSLKLDENGNIYLCGYFGGTTDFDPGAGVATLNGSINGTPDAFLAKYDADGNYIWAEKISGTGFIQALSLSLDSAKNVYITGSFEATASLNQGAGILNLVSNGDEDIFIAKYNEVGELVWAKNLGGISSDRGEGISVDAYGNSYITGRFSDTVYLDPGVGSSQVISNGVYDVLITKLDANGNYIWGKSAGSSSVDNGSGIALDLFNNVYVTGNFTDTVDFDPGVGVSEVISKGSDDIFVLKLSCAPSMFTLSVEACDSYVFNGVTYTTDNNTATDTLVNASGCDSIVTLDLTITIIDLNTSLSGDTLSANSSTASYQWIDCANNTIISGENGQSFIASQTGDYAVILSENGCSDTSACTSVNVSVGIKELQFQDLNIFPNPSTGKFTIANINLNNEQLNLYDLSGKLVLQLSANHNNNFDVSDLEKGIYLLEIHRNDEILRAKLIKE